MDIVSGDFFCCIAHPYMVDLLIYYKISGRVLRIVLMATAARRRNSWATSGVVKTPGIPAPTGRYNVGCIDIMAESGLLVRLYYPTHVQENQGYQYASAIPDSQYVKSSCEIYKTRPAWLFTALLTTLTGTDSKIIADCAYIILCNRNT